MCVDIREEINFLNECHTWTFLLTNFENDHGKFPKAKMTPNIPIPHYMT